MSKVVFSEISFVGRFLPASAKPLQLLKEKGITVKLNELGRILTEEELVKALQGVDGVLASNGHYSARVIESAKDLKIIARVGVGYEKVDVATATRRGVYITLNSIPELSKAVAEEAITLMLCALRRTTTVDNHMREGIYDVEGDSLNYREAYPITLGIVGLGRIGLEVAKRARGLEMRVIYHDVVRKPELEGALGVEYRTLDQLLAESDVISLNTPLSAGTKALIGAKEIAQMKKDAIVINTSRGAVIEEQPLYDALAAGRLGGAGLSVFSKEPLSEGSPFYKLGEKLPNVVLFPHTSGSGVYSIERRLMASVEGIVDVFEGRKPKYVLNQELLSTGVGKAPP